MNKKELVEKVVKKFAEKEQEKTEAALKLALERRILEQIGNLIEDIKESEPENIISTIESFVNKLNLDNEKFAELIISLVLRYQITSDPKIKEQFKILVKKHELQPYLKGLFL